MDRGRPQGVARFFLLICLVMAGCAAPRSDEVAAAAPAPVLNAAAGIYTVSQADQGEQIFTRVCGVCHARHEFTGPMFEMTWMAESVGDLFQHISTAMPQDRPGSLEPEEYAAVVAHLLRLNGRPPGSDPLPPDPEILGRIRW